MKEIVTYPPGLYFIIIISDLRISDDLTDLSIEIAIYNSKSALSEIWHWPESRWKMGFRGFDTLNFTS